MKKLIFVYSSGSSLFDDVSGAVRKAVGVGSLCSLCNITYGVIKQKEPWKEFVEQLKIDIEYYHSDEIPVDVQAFIKKNGILLPVVLMKSDDMYSVIVLADGIEACNGDPECLINKIKPYI
jgi:hypothetical protein